MQKIVRRRPLRQIAWALGIFCLLATGATSAWAKPKVHKSGVSALAERQRQAAQQLRAGREALERGELGAAARDLAASYRTYPDPEVLHQLGLLAIAQRETLVAKDFLRRYLADPNRAKDAEPPSERVRRILEQPISSGAEMRVDGPEGALLLLDGRLVGVLPLSQALLVSAGLHKLVLESEGSRIEGAVTAQPGRLVDARFDQTAEGVLVTMPAAVVLLASMGGVSKENEQIFRQTIERSVRRENLALFDPTLARAKLPAECRKRKCALEATEQTGSEYALLLQLNQEERDGGQNWQLATSLFDASMADTAGAVEQRCNGCTVSQASATLAEALRQLLLQGTMRPRGTVEISSTPSGAEVWLAGHKLGSTPFKRPVWTGAHDLFLRHSGFADKKIPLVVEEGKVTTIATILIVGSSDTPVVESAPAQKPAAPAESSSRPRPRWRLAVGGAAIGAGVLLSGLGISALVVQGQCIESANPFPAPAPCPAVFNTRGAGAGLLTVGLGLAVGGSILILVK